MPLNYSLYPNKVSKDKDAYRALVKNRRQYTLDDVVRLMAARNLRLNEAEIKGILGVFMEEVSGILKNGGSVSTPLFKAQCSIAGLFDGLDDSFYRNRHQVKVNLSTGSLLKTMAGQISPRKKEGHSPRPFVHLFTDMRTGTVNSTVTPGGPAIIKGARLKFDPEDQEQGVFFASNVWQFIRVPGVLRNTFSQLMFMVPADLPPGTYQLEVKSKLKTQTIRTGTLDRSLIVS